MTDKYEKELWEAYENAYFMVLMNRLAQRNGARLLALNEALQSDPAAAVPKELEKQCLALISDSFKKKKPDPSPASKQERAPRFRWGLAHKLAVLILLLALLVTCAFAASPTLRAKVLNMVLDVSDTHTVVSFVAKDPSGEYEFTPGWLPEGFTLCDELSSYTFSWKDYENGDGASIFIEKSSPSERDVDTEGAAVTAVDIDGWQGAMVEEGDEVRILWLDGDRNIVWFVTAEKVSKENVLAISENLE